MKNTDFVVETQIEVYGIENDTFKVSCFDGFAIAVSDTDSKKVVRLTYPKLSELGKDELWQCLDYRGLPPSERVDYGDVMMRFGRVVKPSVVRV